ncbi:hypothetical protein BG004_007039 [Podila humilis]|nr:hypothetical protein BG004_007039 [Podila humilis]
MVLEAISSAAAAQEHDSAGNNVNSGGLLARLRSLTVDIQSDTPTFDFSGHPQVVLPEIKEKTCRYLCFQIWYKSMISFNPVTTRIVVIHRS